MPIRPFDDKGTLRTDGSTDQTQGYSKAEKIYDPADQPKQYSPYGSGTGSPLATPVSTAGSLPSGAADGSLALLRVGSWPDTEYVEFIRDAVNSKWISKPFALMAQGDQSYMGTNTTAYSYIGTSNVGGATGAMGWTTRPIRRADLLLTAGLTLQAAFTAIIFGSSAPATYTVQAFFFNHNDGDAVVGSSDGTAAAAALATPLVSPANTTITFKATGWQNVVKNGTANALVAADVTKANLWPRLYGKVASGVAYGSIIDVDLQCRWVV